MPQTVHINYARHRAPGLQRLLYIEDEPDIQAIVTLTLEELGQFTVLGCSSGSEAIAAAADFAPDLILLDVMIPGMDGQTTLKALRQLPGLASTPVIFMTAKTGPKEMAELKKQGAIAVIAKPFDPLTLCDEIRSAWRTQFNPPS